MSRALEAVAGNDEVHGFCHMLCYRTNRSCCATNSMLRQLVFTLTAVMFTAIKHVNVFSVRARTETWAGAS